MKLRLLLAAVILPGMALILIPGVIVYTTRATQWRASVASPSTPWLWLAALLGLVGLTLAAWTVTLFVRIGEGTLAPWDPPRWFVVRGPYRHMRNPMITATFLILLAEALFLHSWPILLWFGLFVGANLVYIPLVEERQLAARFGDGYIRYRRQVPGWIPRITPWTQKVGMEAEGDDLTASAGAGRPGAPSEADVVRIANVDDAVIRNLQITQCYHELSAAFAMRTGPDANWCSFATWASKQAGQTIRKEDLTQLLKSAFASAPAAEQAGAEVVAMAQEIGPERRGSAAPVQIWELLNPAAMADRASQAVGRGNRKVFAEIGREFARFLAACPPEAPYDEADITRFCAQLRPGDPPEGQRFLRQAFRHYYQAFFETSAKRRAEFMLLANLEIGFHEQTRLQPEIGEALDAAFIDPRAVMVRLLGNLFPFYGWLVHAALFLLRLVRGPTRFDAALEVLTVVARKQARMLISELMMTISFPPDVRLSLGKDLDARFPAPLEQIADPELQALLGKVDPTPDTLLESGATDWADLPERLHFIADLFRCYQEWPGLIDPPFNPAQVQAIKAGQRPAGAL